MFRGGRGNGPGSNDRSSDNGRDDDVPARGGFSGRGRGAFSNVDDSRPKDNQNDDNFAPRGGFRGGRGAGTQNYDNQPRDNNDRDNGSSGVRGGFRGGMQADRDNGSSAFRGGSSTRGRGNFNSNYDDNRQQNDRYNDQRENNSSSRGGFRGQSDRQNFNDRQPQSRDNNSSSRGGFGGQPDRYNDQPARENRDNNFSSRGGFRGQSDRYNDQPARENNFSSRGGFRGQSDRQTDNYDRQQSRENNFSSRGGFRGQSDRQTDNYDRQQSRENNFDSRGQNNYQNSGDRFQSRNNDGYNDSYNRDGPPSGRGRGAQMNRDTRPPRDNDGYNDSYNQQQSFGRSDQYADNGPVTRGRGGRGGFDSRQSNDNFDDRRDAPTRGRGGFNSNREQSDFGRNDQYADNGPTTHGRGGRGASSFDSRQDFNDRRNDFNDSRDNYGQRQEFNDRRNFDNQEDSYGGAPSNRGRGGFSSRGRNFDNQEEGSAPVRGRGGFSSRGRNFDNQEDNYDGAPSNRGRGGFSSRGRNFDNQEDSYGGASSNRGRGGFSHQQDGGRSCYNCGGEGHMSRDCLEPRQERPQRQNKCYNCGGEGHMSRDCLEPRQERPAPQFGNAPGECHHCHEYGHFSRECPQKPAIPDSEKKYVPQEVTTEQLFEDANQVKTENNVYEEDNAVEVINFPDDIRVFEKWADADFMPAILNNITRRESYVKPREFQAKTIPIILEGYDVKGQAETGSGKSAAFLLPIIQILAKQFENSTESRGTKVSALIIEPVRELADQLCEEARMFAVGTNVVVNSSIGKVRMDHSRAQLQRGCDLLVVTPGRGGQIVEDDLIDVSELKILVLDEADQLLDEEYQDQLDKIFTKLPPVDKRQTLFFSATLWSEVHEFADKLCKPDCISIRSNFANKRITQKFVLVPHADRVEYVINLVLKIKEETEGEMPKTLIFVASKNQANMLALRFCNKGIKSMTANGDISPEERKRAITEFKKGGYRVMVSTNVSSRGIDINDLGHVINVEIPDPKHKGAKVTYLHRIGRTGRVSHGTATTFFDPEYEVDQQMAEFIIETLKDVNQEIPDFVQAAVDPSVSYNRSAAVATEFDQEELDVAEPEF